MLDDAEARIAALDRERDAMQAHLEEGMRMMLALQRERDQAAPVLAVAEGMVDDGHICAMRCVHCEALEATVAAWRAGKLA